MPELKVFVLLESYHDGNGYTPAVDWQAKNSMYYVAADKKELEDRYAGDGAIVLPATLKYSEPQADYVDKFFKVVWILKNRLKIEDDKARNITLTIMGKIYEK